MELTDKGSIEAIVQMVRGRYRKVNIYPLSSAEIRGKLK